MSGYRDSKLLSVGMPIAFVFFALAMVYIQYHRLTEARADVATSEKKLSELETLVKKSQVQPAVEKIPAVPAASAEDTQFLEDLKRSALETHTALIKWNSTVRPAGTEVAGAAQPPELKGVTEVLGDLEVFGDYDGVRAFVQRLQTGPRLVNLNNVAWRRGTKTGTHLQMTVIRYVKEARSSGGTP